MAATTRITLVACLSSGCFSPVGNGGETDTGTGSEPGTGTGTATAGETDPPTTGEPSQCTWRNLEISGPPARSEHSMVYDSDHDQVILFGGVAEGAELNDLWTFAGAQWTMIASTAPPTPRRSHAAAYDPMLKVMVVFGGATGQQDTTVALGDTHHYDPVLKAWKPMPSTMTPKPRYGASMAHYADSVLLFGGNLNPLTTDSEHWSWDGTNWTPLDATNNNRPAARSRHMVAPDSSGGKLLLYGGCKEGSLCVFNTPTKAYNDTWSWDGVQWKLLSETAGDGQLGAMALQSKNNKLYRFGEHDTFLWDSGMWSPPQPTDLISGLDFAVADHSIGLIRFGGNIANQNTWVLDCPP